MDRCLILEIIGALQKFRDQSKQNNHSLGRKEAHLNLWEIDTKWLPFATDAFKLWMCKWYYLHRPELRDLCVCCGMQDIVCTYHSVHESNNSENQEGQFKFSERCT